MRRATWTFLALVTGLSSMGCRPETPRPGDVCLDLYGTSQTNDVGCQKTVCVAAEQEFKPDSSQLGQGLVCEHCTNIPADHLGTDDFTLSLAVTYQSPELDVQFYFDNRVSLDFSLANLQKYAFTAQGEYKTSVGNSRFIEQPFEVLGYEGGKLHVHTKAKLIELAFSTLGEPMFIPVAGVPVLTADQTCVYGHDSGYWPPPVDAPFYELDIDLDLPVTMTAY